MLLVQTTQSKIYWDLAKSQPRLTPYLLENIRTMADHDMPNAHMLKYVPGKPIMGQDIIVDAVDMYSEVFTRAKAYLYTLAYCSIANPGFMDTQTALMVSEKMWSLLGTTYGSGQKPPVEHFVSA